MRPLVLALASVVTASFLGAGCSDPPPPPPPPPPPAAPQPELAPPPTECARSCARAAECDVPEMGTTPECVGRCERTGGDVYRCLREAERCDQARACTEVWVSRVGRPAVTPVEGERFDARALGADVEVALEGRLVNASTEGSRYDLVLALRGRAHPDAGLEGLDAGPDALPDAAVDAGLASPDVYVRLGAFSSDGRLPLVRVIPPLRLALPGVGGGAGTRPSEEGPLLEHGAFFQGTGDYHRVRQDGDVLVIEHAFEQGGGSSRERVRSGFDVRLRVQLAPGARVRAVPVIDP